MLLAHLCEGFIRLCVRGPGRAGVFLWVGPMVLARDGVVASCLPRPGGTLALEEYGFLDDTSVFTPGSISLPLSCKGNSWGHAGLGLGSVGVWWGFLGFWGCKGNRGLMPGTLAKVWPPSLFSYDACLVFWPNWASGGNNGRPKCETSFPSSLPRGITWVFRSESNFHETLLGKTSVGSVDWEGQTPWAFWCWSHWFGGLQCWWVG